MYDNLDTARKQVHRAKNLLKIWEDEYKKSHGSKPDKDALKEAPNDIKEAYKLYWKLSRQLKGQTNTQSNSTAILKEQFQSFNCVKTHNDLPPETNVEPRISSVEDATKNKEHDDDSINYNDKSASTFTKEDPIENELRLNSTWGKHLNKKVTVSKQSDKGDNSLYNEMAAKMKSHVAVKIRTSLKRNPVSKSLDKGKADSQSIIKPSNDESESPPRGDGEDKDCDIFKQFQEISNEENCDFSVNSFPSSSPPLVTIKKLSNTITEDQSQSLNCLSVLSSDLDSKFVVNISGGEDMSRKMPEKRVRTSLLNFAERNLMLNLSSGEGRNVAAAKHDRMAESDNNNCKTIYNDDETRQSVRKRKAETLEEEEGKSDSECGVDKNDIIYNYSITDDPILGETEGGKKSISSQIHENGNLPKRNCRRKIGGKTLNGNEPRSESTNSKVDDSDYGNPDLLPKVKKSKRKVTKKGKSNRDEKKKRTTKLKRTKGQEGLLDDNVSNRSEDVVNGGEEYDDLVDMTRDKLSFSGGGTSMKGQKGKFYSKDERLRFKMSSGKCNENFVKINIKKKVFVRGKRRMNCEKYKRAEWKKRQTLQKAEAGNEKSIKKLTCFKCGDFGHWATKCPGKIGDKLMPLPDYEAHCEGSFLTLNEAAQLARGVKQSGESREGGNKTLLYPSRVFGEDLTEKCANSDEEILSDWDEDFVAELEANEKEIVLAKCSNDSKQTESESIVQPYFSPLEPGRVDHSEESWDHVAEMKDALKLFGFTSFRNGQEEAIARILRGQSTLMVQSTGSGKSLCYQLPAFLYAKKSKCITLCVSPLVSLMEDQVSGLPHFLKAVCIHTQQSSSNRDKAIKALQSGAVHVLLVSPEAIVSSSGSGVLGSLLKELPPIAFACLDEAHCLSEWSHNFRPSYLQICAILRERMKVNTFLGLTATATSETIRSIAKHLEISENGIITGSYIPNNLKLSVSRDCNREKALIELLTGDRFSECSSSIIIYCTRREECERIATLIRSQLMTPSRIDTRSNNMRKRVISMDAEAYHAGLSGYRRQQIQKRFMSGKLRIVVATVAFGMGIDKADVEGIIHYNMPRNIESYVQEVGRAGRNGDTAHCHLFLDSVTGKDIQELKRHIFANSVDRFTVRKLLNRIFSTYTNSLNSIPSSSIEPDLGSNLGCEEARPEKSDDLKETLLKRCSSHCQGHEVAVPIEELIEALDLPEENIQTLLCYLQSQPKCGLKLHHHAYSSCKVFCYGGPRQLLAVSRKCPPLAAAIALERKRGKSFDQTNSITFPVVELAAIMNWESRVVKQDLKRLEWNMDELKVGGSVKPSGVKVEFGDLAFRMTCRCDLNEEEQDQLLDDIYERSCVQERDQLRKLQYTYNVLREHSHGSIVFCCDQVDETKSDSLKKNVREYFGPNGSQAQLSSVQFDQQLYLLPDLENRIRGDVRSFLSIHSDQTWNGRAVARVMHGISSPNFPSKVWGRVRRFWRLHLNVDFNLLVSIATKEILNSR